MGAKVWHYPYSGKGRHRAEVATTGILGRMVRIHLEGDPFPVNVDHRRIELMQEEKRKMAAATATKTKQPPSAKELRNRAKALGIEGWEEMDRETLTKAVRAARNGGEATGATKRPAKKAPAKKASAAKKAPAKKAAKKSTATGRANPDPDDPIPFRPGTNLYLIAKALMKGGKRIKIATALAPKLTFNPRKQDKKKFDAVAETDRRLKVIGYILKNKHGWTYEHKGRGEDATIKCTPPS